MCEVISWELKFSPEVEFSRFLVEFCMMFIKCHIDTTTATKTLPKKVHQQHIVSTQIYSCVIAGVTFLSLHSGKQLDREITNFV